MFSPQKACSLDALYHAVDEVAAAGHGSSAPLTLGELVDLLRRLKHMAEVFTLAFPQGSGVAPDPVGDLARSTAALLVDLCGVPWGSETRRELGEIATHIEDVAKIFGSQTSMINDLREMHSIVRRIIDG